MIMCSQSVSGSSLLSGYNEDDVRERSGRSRREFEEIDAVLYDEEKSKRATIKKICEEWSSKPHFRIRGRVCQIEREERFPFSTSTTSRSMDLNVNPSSGSSALDLLSSEPKDSGFASNEINVRALHGFHRGEKMQLKHFYVFIHLNWICVAF